MPDVRDWVRRYNADGPDGPIDRKSPATKPLLTAAQRAAVVDVVMLPLPMVWCGGG